MLKTGARIAGRFHLDPVAVLSEQDMWNTAVRAAAWQIVHADDVQEWNQKNRTKK